PFFAFRPMPVSRRVEDNTMIFFAPAYFPSDEFNGVLYYPANVRESGKRHVLIAPGHDLPDRVHMRGIGACLTCRERSAAGIGEQIKEFRAGGLQFRDGSGDEIPVDRLFGKNADMFERGQAQPEPQVK